MRNPRLVGVAVALILATSFQAALAASSDSKTVGRVRVTTLHDAKTTVAETVSDALSMRLAPRSGKRFADRRVISIRPRGDDPEHLDATIYDYTVEQAFDLVLDAQGNEISRKQLSEQPARSKAELADAGTIVRENGDFAEALASGAISIYEPMPPVTVDAEGRRLVNVGVMSPAKAGHALEKNEIVSVHIPTGRVVRYPTGAPETSRATLLACGPGTSGCSYAEGPCSFYQVVWPAVNPVWKFKVRHPSCTNAVQADGTGLELTDVYYGGRLILKRAEVPVLNVLYEDNVCGPYRDWMDSEDCFQATGTDVPNNGSGIRVASAPPSTLCESGTPGSDAGNFKGVAIYDEGDALWVMTETDAGWYRYVMEWRLHLDGTIEPIFGFGATSNGCTCNHHDHHAYWRLEWAIDAVINGSNDDPATGINTLERRRAGTLDDYDPISTEGTFTRPPVGWEQDVFRVKNQATGNGYTIEPGEFDGSATSDVYAKWDLAGLALNSSQINDQNANTSINLTPWLTGETLGATKRLVTWYHSTFDHDDPGGTGEPCELAGPKLVPLRPCAGSVSFDRSAYSCASPVTIVLNDSDLAGTGTVNLGVTSGTEAVAEPLALSESPAGSGRFQGTIATKTGPAVAGDGKISVAHGDTVHVQYVDVSACGTPNVPVSKSASVDCSLPVISNVTVASGSGTATISWNTGEASTGVVHYGTTVATASSVAAGAVATSHAGLLSGLADCTTYYYWVESADAAGNNTASNAGGGYFAFTTGQAQQATFASSGGPVSIPDGNPAGATKTIAATGVNPIVDANVTVNITHTYDNDLTLTLITPQSTSIPLAVREGQSSNNYTNTVFDDEAANAIVIGFPPFTGSFRPDSPLSAADGFPAAGSWTFKVVDQTDQDTGTIDNWTLNLTYASTPCVPGGPPSPVPDGSFGTGMKASRLTGGTGMHVSWDVATCTARNDHLLYGPLASVSSYALTGAVCGAGPLGSYDWVNVPAGNLWFVVVSDDAAAREGSWGTNGAGAQRMGTTPSGLCGFITRSNAGTCP